MKLDLGGTACYESKDAVIITLDGTTADDEVTPVVIGDYNYCPFPDNTFDEALGSCYLEDIFNPKELLRVMKPNGIVSVKGCDGYTRKELKTIRNRFIEVGFVVLEEPGLYREDGMWSFDSPFVFRKE